MDDSEKKALLKLIAEDKIREAISTLIALAPNEQIKDQASLLGGRLNNLSKGQVMGTMDYEKHTVERNTIARDTQELIKSIGDPTYKLSGDNYYERLWDPEDFDPLIRTANEYKIGFAVAGITLLFIGLGIITYGFMSYGDFINAFPDPTAAGGGFCGTSLFPFFGYITYNGKKERYQRYQLKLKKNPTGKKAMELDKVFNKIFAKT